MKAKFLMFLVLPAVFFAAVLPVLAAEEPAKGEEAEAVEREKSMEDAKLEIEASLGLNEYYKDQGITTGVIQPELKVLFSGFYAGVMLNYDARGMKEMTEAKTSLGYETRIGIFTAGIDYSYRAFMGVPGIETVCENEGTVSVSADLLLSPAIAYTRCLLAGNNFFYLGFSHAFEIYGSELSISPEAELALYEGYAGITHIDTEIKETFGLGDSMEFAAIADWVLSFDRNIFVNGLFFGISLSWKTGL